MEFLSNGFSLEVPPCSFPLSTDSMVLAHFVRLPKKARVLDLGSGCGALGLLLCARDEGCHVTGLELDPASHQAALNNIRTNGLESRMESICADAGTVPQQFSPGSFSVVVSNPPYFSGGPASRTHSQARREDSLPPDILIKSAAWALKFGGDFFLVHRPEKLAQLISLGSQVGLEAKRLLLLRHTASGPVTLILLQLRKGGKPGLTLEEAFLWNANGTPSPYYRDVYHIEEA